jgi:tetratricopeptide (TPR) repeat protein
MSIFSKYKTYFYTFIAIALIIYFPVFFNGFAWDDFPYIIDNSELHTLNFQAHFGQNKFSSGLFYRPIPSFYFATLFSLFNQNPFFYHFIQLALHIINTHLLFVFFLLFFSRRLALFLAFLFIVHPINVESVAFISSSTSELYFLFGISALLLGVGLHPTYKKIFLIFGLLLLSILTKETGLLFILLVLLYRYLYHLKKIKEFFIIGIGAILLYVLLRIFIGGAVFSSSYFAIPIRELSLQERLTHIPAIVVYYLKTFLFPQDLYIWQIWVFKEVNFQNFVFPLLICIALFLLLVYIAFRLSIHDKKYPTDNGNKFQKFLFFSSWFVIGMGLILQVVPLNMTVADRWFYFPIVGLLGIIGVGVQIITPLIRVHKKIYLICAVIIISLFSTRTFVRVLDWKDNVTLYKHDVKLGVENPILMDQLAVALYQEGNVDEALLYAKKSVSISPDVRNLSHLGILYYDKKQYANAIRAHLQAIQMYNARLENNKQNTDLVSVEDLHLENSYVNLAFTYILMKKPQEAIMLLKEGGLPKFHTSPRLYFSLAIAQYEAGKRQNALEAIKKSYQLSPNQLTENILYRIEHNLQLNLH